jgi:hypothetical protein
MLGFPINMNLRAIPIDSRKYRSIVLWPDSVSTGRTPNESFDTHANRESAEAVCRGIEREGLGGERKIFPISTRVEPITEDSQSPEKEETK